MDLLSKDDADFVRRMSFINRRKRSVQVKIHRFSIHDSAVISSLPCIKCFAFSRSTAGNFGPGHIVTGVNEDSTSTPDEQSARNDSDSSEDEIPLSQIVDTGGYTTKIHCQVLQLLLSYLRTSAQLIESINFMLQLS